ncbi:hypothetical protein [Nonomuraea sp. NPDC003804]|uniref:hypothetical protein n=1 Tax=Nonomuraea sp. NPDC003804 TaxID=3154547 RepID=UPI0033B225B3
MTLDNDPEPVFERMDTLCGEVFHALSRGLQVADYIHSVAGWNPAADTHLHRHLTRREAMEDLKQLNPELEDDDDLGLPMSGLLFNLPVDTVRVWHTIDAKIPAPRTEKKRRFIQQESVMKVSLFDDEALGLFETSPRPHRNNMIIQWTADGLTITRFDLVRPVDVQGGCVVIDWRLPLLDHYAPVQDVRYRRRDGEEGTGEEEVQ